MKVEIGGKTIGGRERREWYQGMHSNVSGRACEIVRFKKETTARVLVRWEDDGSRGSVRKGKTQWVWLYEIDPETSVVSIGPCCSRFSTFCTNEAIEPNNVCPECIQEAQNWA